MNGLTTHKQTSQRLLIIRPRPLAAMLSISLDTLRIIAASDRLFPPRVQLSERLHGFSMKSVEAYIAAKELEVTNESIS